MQRFKAALPTGNYPGNPEDLVRDDNGAFVLYEDVKKPAVDEQKKKFAEAVDAYWCHPSERTNKEFCMFCYANGDTPDVIEHSSDCVVPLAAKYLESLEGE